MSPPRAMPEAPRALKRGVAAFEPQEPAVACKLQMCAAMEPASPDTLEVFATCPVVHGAASKTYLKRVREVARWSERQGCRGVLVHADEALVDPWLLAHVAVQSTRASTPLVALQPAHMHPFTVARTIATFASLYGRQIYVQWVAGAVGDDTPHDERYERLVEFATIVRRLTDGEAVSCEGRYHDARGLQLRQPVDAALRPEFVVSGSSAAGRAASKALQARSLTHALPPDEDHLFELETGPSAALRLGIIARSHEEEAWRTAYRRFQRDQKRGLVGAAARKASIPTHTHEDVLRLAEERAGAGSPYWTLPFENYQTLCPYLVGSHEEVSAALARYVQRGFGTFILDEPDSEADLENARIVFENTRRNILEAA